jgi:aminopeptidase YwaD
MLNKFLPLFILLSSICNCPFPEGRSEVAEKEEIRRQIENVDCDNDDRLEEVKKLFLNVGAKPAEINVENYQNVKNVAVTLIGKTDETIVVGAHYDKTTLGCGVIDNWSGVVLVANLYKYFKKNESEKTIRFVAFGEEEKGLVGSTAMVKAIPEKQKKNYCAMVNFDSFGFSNLWTLESISDKKLIEIGKYVAQKRKQSFLLKNYMGASSDSKSFQEGGIPAITLSGVNDQWRLYLHQRKDQVENINFEKIYQNYKFSVDFLTLIEAKDCDSFKNT